MRESAFGVGIGVRCGRSLLLMGESAPRGGRRLPHHTSGVSWGTGRRGRGSARRGGRNAARGTSAGRWRATAGAQGQLVVGWRCRTSGSQRAGRRAWISRGFGGRIAGHRCRHRWQLPRRPRARGSRCRNLQTLPSTGSAHDHRQLPPHDRQRPPLSAASGADCRTRGGGRGLGRTILQRLSRWAKVRSLVSPSPLPPARPTVTVGHENGPRPAYADRGPSSGLATGNRRRSRSRRAAPQRRTGRRTHPPGRSTGRRRSAPSTRPRGPPRSAAPGCSGTC